MTPRERAKAEFLRQNPGADFEFVEARHRECGHVLDTEEFYMLWRRVRPHWGLCDMLDLSKSEGESAFIWAIAGDWRKAISIAIEITPVNLAFYERRGRARIIETHRVFRQSASA